MRPQILVAAALAMTLISASCGGGDQGDGTTGVAAATTDQSSEPEIRTVGEDFSEGGVAQEVDPEPAEVEADIAETDPEQALLEFAQCMRENGLPDFVDPTVDAAGTVQWRQMFADSGIDPASDDFQQGQDVCRHHFEGIAFGRDGGGLDLTEVQDTLLGVAQCLRAEGVEVDDPGTGDNPGTGLFGEAFDLTDPGVQDALETCRGELGGLGGRGARAGGNQ